MLLTDKKQLKELEGMPDSDIDTSNSSEKTNWVMPS